MGFEWSKSRIGSIWNHFAFHFALLIESQYLCGNLGHNRKAFVFLQSCAHPSTVEQTSQLNYWKQSYVAISFGHQIVGRPYCRCRDCFSHESLIHRAGWFVCSLMQWRDHTIGRNNTPGSSLSNRCMKWRKRNAFRGCFDSSHGKGRNTTLECQICRKRGHSTVECWHQTNLQ